MCCSIRTQNVSTFAFLVDAGLGNLPYVHIIQVYINIRIAVAARLNKARRT